MLQDASYESLLKSKQQQLHTQTAQVLEQEFAETIELHPELVAHHYTEASLAEQAIPYWQQAGQRAVQSSAYPEAIEQLKRGLGLLATLPDTHERAQQELSFRLPLGAALVTTQGYGAPDVEQVFSRVQELCEQLPATVQLIPALHGIRTFHMMQSQLPQAHVLSEQVLGLEQGEVCGDAAASLQRGNALFGETALFQGKFRSALEHFEQHIAYYSSDQYRAGGLLFIDTGVASMGSVALTLWYLGYPEQALKRSRESVALAHEIEHPSSSAWSWCYASWVAGYRREWSTCQEQAETAVSISSEYGFPSWAALGTLIRGRALTWQGDYVQGVAQVNEGLNSWRATGAQLLQPPALGWLAEGYWRAGKSEEGLQQATEALVLVERSGERHCEAELYQHKGELLLQKSQANAPQAEGSFQQALEVSRHQQAKSLELRAATSLARLWQQQGKKREAHDLLAPVYNWFTEGFDTADLKDAKALIEELS